MTNSIHPFSVQPPLCRETTRRCVQKPAPDTLCRKTLAPSNAVFLSDIYLLTRLDLSPILYDVIQIKPLTERKPSHDQTHRPPPWPPQNQRVRDPHGACRYHP